MTIETEGVKGVLDSMGVCAGVDASSLVHNYLNSYENFLPWARDDEFTLLFIGSSKNKAINVWRTYFYNAQIVNLAFDAGGAFKV